MIDHLPEGCPEGIDPRDVPHDFESPDWEDFSKQLIHVHEWKRYMSDPLREIWDTLTRVQKAVISSRLQEIADNEEWD